ncbi:unnamed protein product [Effrenium voratum]|nr:unnamed protein product [Effrenium voratum]
MMGESCNFAHSHQELRATPDLVATKLCFQWSSKGRCKKGSACTFAHGASILSGKPNPTRISWEPMKVMLEPGSWIWKHQRVEVCDLGPIALLMRFLPGSGVPKSSCLLGFMKQLGMWFLPKAPMGFGGVRPDSS